MKQGGPAVLSIDQLQVRADVSKADPLIAGLSLAVKPGEAIGLKGPSGCGKTTLMRSIAGLIDPAGGSISLDGRRPDEIGWPGFRRRVGLVPQRPVVWDGTVSVNLERPYAFASHDRRYDPDDADGMLELLGLIDKLGAEATTLSEGERQRVCLVRALLTRPDFLLLDEPTSALDGEAVRWVESLLTRAMTEHGLGILLTTHAGWFADRFCSRVIDLAEYAPRAKAVADA